MEHIKVRFIPSGLGEAKYPPNPRFSAGMEIKIPCDPGAKVCFVKFPKYPAPECGVWSIHCTECGFSCLVTVTGRVDDPLNIMLPCKKGK